MDRSYTLNTYKIYKNDLSEQVVAIKSGFSWPAFFFGPFWALVKKRWELALGLLCGSILAKIISSIAQFIGTTLTDSFALGGMLGFLVNIGYMYMIGHYGNEWLQRTMLKQGYHLVYEAIAGASRQDAVNRYNSSSSASKTREELSNACSICGQRVVLGQFISHLEAHKKTIA